MEYTVRLLTTEDGRCPFEKWFLAIRDRETIVRIRSRIRRIRDGNLGDTKSLGDGLFELRLDFGPGYRIYYGILENTLLVLAVGGDKASQDRDIALARRVWKENKDAPERFQRDF